MDIDKEVRKMDMQMAGMVTTLENIKNMLSQSENTTLDIGKIEKYAMQSKFNRHITEHLDEELTYKFCVALASAVELIEDKDTKIKQYYYIFRIYHAHYFSTLSENLLRDAKIFSISDWEILINGISKEVETNLFFDFLLMLSLDGVLKQEQIDYLCEIFAYADYKEKDIEIIFKLVKAVLMCDEDQLYQLASQIDVNYYVSYLGYTPDYYVLGKVSQIASCSNQNVMLVNEKIKDQKEVIDIDKYGKKKVIFRNCHFENINGFVSKKTEVLFIDCLFVECKQENLNTSSGNSFVWGWGSSYRYNKSNKQVYFLEMNQVVLKNTIFKDCAVEGFKNNSSVLKLSNSKVTSCRFENCKVGVHDHSNSSCSILDADTTTIENCVFLNCSSYGEGEYGRYDNFYIYVAKITNGNIIGNLFENCSCNGENVADKNFNNYILAYNNNSHEKDNIFKNCSTLQCKFDDSYCHEMKVRLD